MVIVSIEIEIGGNRVTASASSTRDDIKLALGEPDDLGGFSRRQKRGTILKYGDTEFHFAGEKGSDQLLLIWREREVLGERVPEISVKF